jgi:hypothetical protein
MTQEQLSEKANQSPFALEHLASNQIKINQDANLPVSEHLQTIYKTSFDQCLEKAVFLDHQPVEKGHSNDPLFIQYFNIRYNSQKMREFAMRAYTIRDHNTAFATLKLPYNTGIHKQSFAERDNIADLTLNGWCDAFIDRLGEAIEAQYKNNKVINSETIRDFTRFVFGFGPKGSPISMGRIQEKSTSNMEITLYRTSGGGVYGRIPSSRGWRWATLIEPIDSDALASRFKDDIEKNGFIDWKSLRDAIEKHFIDLTDKTVANENNPVSFLRKNNDLEITYRVNDIEKTIIQKDIFK